MKWYKFFEAEDINDIPGLNEPLIHPSDIPYGYMQHSKDGEHRIFALNPNIPDWIEDIIAIHEFRYNLPDHLKDAYDWFIRETYPHLKGFPGFTDRKRAILEKNTNQTNMDEEVIVPEEPAEETVQEPEETVAEPEVA